MIYSIFILNIIRNNMDISIQFHPNNEDSKNIEMHPLNNDLNSYVTQTRSKKISPFRSGLNRLGALMAKNFLRLKRNIPLLFFQITAPTLQLVVFFLCAAGEPFDLPVAVVNLEDDPSAYSKHFLNRINNQTVIQNSYSDLNLAVESVKKQENWGVIYIGPSFSDSLVDRYLQCIYADNETIINSTVKVYLDMTSKVVTTSLIATFAKAFQEFGEYMLLQNYGNTMQATPPLLIDKPIYGEKDATFLEYLAPGVILGSTFFMAMSLTTMSIIIEKKEGLLDRSWIAGLSTWEIITSIMLILFFVMVLQITMELFIAIYVFNLLYRGSLLLLILAALLAGLEGMAAGLFVSSVSTSMDMAMIISLVIFLPVFYASGLMWPLETMPYALRYIGYCLPLTLLAHASRCILSRGWVITEGYIWSGYLISIGWVFAFLLLACFIFSKTK